MCVCTPITNDGLINVGWAKSDTNTYVTFVPLVDVLVLGILTLPTVAQRPLLEMAEVLFSLSCFVIFGVFMVFGDKTQLAVHCLSETRDCFFPPIMLAYPFLTQYFIERVFRFICSVLVSVSGFRKF